MRFEFKTKESNNAFWSEIELRYPEIFKKALEFRSKRLKTDFDKESFSTKWLFEFFKKNGIYCWVAESRSVKNDKEKFVFYVPIVTEIPYIDFTEDTFKHELNDGWGRISCEKTMIDSVMLIRKKHWSDKILIELCFEKYKAIYER